MVERHEPGARLIEPGRVETHAFLVEAGEVQVRLDAHASRVVRAGELLGELALLSDAPRSTEATTARGSRVRRIERREVMFALQAVLGALERT